MAPKDEEELVFSTDEDPQTTVGKSVSGGFGGPVMTVIAICAIVVCAELALLVGFVASDSDTTVVGSLLGSTSGAATTSIVVNPSSDIELSTSADVEISGGGIEYLIPTNRPPVGENPCAGKKPKLPNVECIIDAVANVGPQAGANVTKGYRGELVVDHDPITTPYFQNSMCPVNVHWHLGAEHYSKGEFDENGTGPMKRRLAEKDARLGFQCNHYDENDEMYTKPYDWKHCVDMKVGETYEVHWPHSAAGACGTLNQYQTPFYDGVFCRDGVLTETHSQIGVQAQIFTIVNDEDYYYPDLMRGMIVDGDKGIDLAMYTGSTTGTSRNNEICSQYSPITWQVDRKCHKVSASTFDKMCADMLSQRDDMSDDLYPHGSRELVADEIAANNQANRRI